jgi:hypothetical protein
MTYGHLKPQKATQSYVPRVFGFKINKPWHKRCKLLFVMNFHGPFVVVLILPHVCVEMSMALTCKMKCKSTTIDLPMKNLPISGANLSSYFVREFNRAFVSFSLLPLRICHSALQFPLLELSWLSIHLGFKAINYWWYWIASPMKVGIGSLHFKRHFMVKIKFYRTYYVYVATRWIVVTLFKKFKWCGTVCTITYMTRRQNFDHNNLAPSYFEMERILISES